MWQNVFPALSAPLFRESFHCDALRMTRQSLSSFHRCDWFICRRDTLPCLTVTYPVCLLPLRQNKMPTSDATAAQDTTASQTSLTDTEYQRDITELQSKYILYRHHCNARLTSRGEETDLYVYEKIFKRTGDPKTSRRAVETWQTKGRVSTL